MEQQLQVSPSLQAEYPGACIGVLVMHGVTNPTGHPELDRRVDAMVDALRSELAGLDRAALKSMPPISAYESYYRRFKKTYHVRLQLESVVLKGKPLPRAGALVQAMFMAELKNRLLTAGHDADSLQFPLTAQLATGAERYTLLSGAEQVCKSGDMAIADREGVVSSIVYGPDSRTRLNDRTRAACFTVYGVPGVDPTMVVSHLGDLRDFIASCAPEAEVKELTVHMGER